MASALQRQRMSYDEYLALPESVRAEWVDGEVVVTPSADYLHQKVSWKLATLLRASLPDLHVIEAVTTRLPNNRERIPDIIVLEREPATPYIEDTPLLLVEILSPSTRREDTVRKSTEYLAAGVGQYWLVDRDDRTLDVFGNDPAGWVELAQAGEGNPTVSVPVAPFGTVKVSLTDILDG